MVAVAESCLTLCDPMDFSLPGFSVLHDLPESAQTPIYWLSDASDEAGVTGECHVPVDRPTRTYLSPRCTPIGTQ